jgi:hypothetical protein
MIVPSSTHNESICIGYYFIDFKKKIWLLSSGNSLITNLTHWDKTLIPLLRG